jgi:hypothetical protein
MRVIHAHGIAAMRLFWLHVESADQVANVGKRILDQQCQSVFQRRLFCCGRVLRLGPLGLLPRLLVTVLRYILEWAL